MSRKIVTSKFLGALASVIAFSCLASVAYGGWFWDARFWSMGYFDTSLNLKNPHGYRGVNAYCLVVDPPAGKSGYLLKEKAPLPEKNQFDLRFKFRHLAARTNTPSYFDLAFFSKDGVTTQMVRVATESIAGTPIPRNRNDEWCDFVLKAAGSRGVLYYSPSGHLERLAELKLAADFSGLNVFATEKNGFALTQFDVRTPEPLPVDPVDKHFADWRSISQPIPGGRTVGPDGASVGLSPAPRAGLRFSPGPKPSKVVVYESAPAGGTGKTTTYEIRISPEHHRARTAVLGLEKGNETNFPNGRIEFVIPGKWIPHVVHQCVRPDLGRYSSVNNIVRQGRDIIRAWDRLPAPQDHPLDIDLTRRADGAIELYLDGSYNKTIPCASGAQVTNIVFQFAEGATYAVKEDSLQGVDTDRYTVIDFSTNPRAKAFVGATSTLKAGLQTIEGVPVSVAAPIDSGDVAICKEGMGSWWLEVEEYHSRSPEDGFPSAVHYRLPAATYAKAHVLFALDPDPKKDRYLTIRLSHYVDDGVGGNMMGDAVLDFSDGKVPENCKVVGTVRKDGKDCPLYLASVPLDVGHLLDVLSGERYDRISSGDYVDFEFVGRCGENGQLNDSSPKPLRDKDSAFNIFGATLEKMPVRILFRQETTGNIFVEGEKDRKTSFIVTALRDGVKGGAYWTVRDADGKELFRDGRKYAFTAAGETNVIEIALDRVKTKGYYSLDVTFVDPELKMWIKHPGAFAILPAPGRLVSKWDSPYGIWWFSVHGVPGDPAIGGPLLQKCGIVRAAWNKAVTPEVCEKYDLTTSRMTLIRFPVDKEKGLLGTVSVEVPDPSDPTGKKQLRKNLPAEEGTEILLRRTLEADPMIEAVMLWHETAPGYGVPEELLGLPVPTNTIAKDKIYALQVDAAARIVHKLAKELKRPIRLQIGNSSSSVGSAVRPLRAGANPDSYDQIGIEIPGQSFPPEQLGTGNLQAMTIARDVAEHYAKRPVRLNGCYEFTSRAVRDIGARQQAEWYMRDILLGLAHDFRHISPGGIFDCKNGYYNTFWGASAMMERAPFFYPKRSIVAYAVLTKCLDGVRFVRELETGSTTVYAVEFRRVDGKTATALWAARGEVAFEISSPVAGEATHMLGATEPIRQGKTVVWGGTSPTYVITDKPLSAVRIAGRAFREDAYIADRAKVAWAIDDIGQVTLKPDPDHETKHTAFLPIFKPSDFTIKQVTDEEKGECIEVALDLTKNKETNRYITEYTTLRFKEPKEIPGKPVVVGVWVKGNSNWGQIRFEIEDAKGEGFRNATINYGCECQDWPGNLAVNFDGWGYVYSALDRTPMVVDQSVGIPENQWVPMGGGDGKIDFPIKVRAITVTMNRTKLGLLKFFPSAPAIRLRDVGGTEEVVPPSKKAKDIGSPAGK